MLVNGRMLALCSRCQRYFNPELKKFISTQAPYFRLYQRSYYDVLGLKRSASQSEIKAAYFELSKQHHPDKSDRDDHAKFVEIGKAYEVLGKPLTRREYDRNTPMGSSGSSSFRPRAGSAQDPFRASEDSNDWYKTYVYDDDEYREARNPNAFYGIKGIPKIPNKTIIFGLLLMAVVGGTLQFIFVFAVSDYRRSQLDERDRKVSMVLQELDRKMKLTAWSHKYFEERIRELAKQGLADNQVKVQEVNNPPDPSEGVQDLDDTAKKFKYNTYYSYPVQGGPGR